MEGIDISVVGRNVHGNLYSEDWVVLSGHVLESASFSLSFLLLYFISHLPHYLSIIWRCVETDA